jgi:aminopeptidase YwaD
MGETVERVIAHLTKLTASPAGRPVGSAANHAAEAYIAGVLRDKGYEVERQVFNCIDWRLDEVGLWIDGRSQPAIANPYSLPCDVTAPVVTAGSLAELEAAELGGRIAVLHGGLTHTPLFPRNFPFFTVAEHQHIADLLEQKGPQAVITVSPMAGIPAPIIEDGDFALPSLTVPAGVGSLLLAAEGSVTALVRSAARPGAAANVIGRRAAPDRAKIVLCAHFDTKPGTPGALDNAAGVATVLALAERLSATRPDTNLEIVAFNGEDHYAAPGEVAYINGCGSEFGRISLVVNIDGVGFKGQPSTVAFFNCPEDWAGQTRAEMAQWPQIDESVPWPEGDHSIFAMQNVPCVALTSGGIHTLIDEILHTPNDTLDRVAPEQIATVVEFLASLLTRLGPPREWVNKGTN